MPDISSLTQGITGIGSGYIKGLVLRKQLEALKEESKRQDMLMEIEVQKSQQQAEALKAESERQKLLFPFAQRTMETEAGMGEARLPIAQAIRQGQPVSPEQETLLYGKTARPQPEQWQTWLMNEPSLTPQLKAQILGKINLQPEKAEDVAMSALKENLPKEEFSSYAKEYLKNQNKLMESLMKMQYGQNLRTGETIRKEGVSAIDEVKKTFKQNLQQLRIKGMEPGVDPKSISQEKYNIHQEYFGRLKEEGQPLPMKEVQNYVKELADEWRKERDELETRGKKWFRSDTSKIVKELDTTYAQKLVDLLGQDLAEEILGSVREEEEKARRK